MDYVRRAIRGRRQVSQTGIQRSGPHHHLEAVASESTRSVPVSHGGSILGRAVWEHYLCFELNRSSDKAIKLFMIHLGNEGVREQVEICPGLRDAFVKVTDDTMTAHKGVWSWTAQEVVNQRLVENASP